MKVRRTLAIFATGILCTAGVVASSVRADGDVDGPGKTATVSLQSAMEVPGTQLQPGNYVFKQSGSQSGWTIIQIFNQSESTLVTTVLAYSNAKLSSDGQTVMTYAAPGSNGQVLEAVTFPGDAAPDQFAYPAAEADRIGAANRVRIPSTGTNDAYPSSLPDAASSWSAPLTNSTAAPAVSAASVSSTSQAMTAQTAPAATDATLPQTASSTPLFGLVGMFAIAGIVALRKIGAAKA
jgi:hypothetical protein